MKYKYLLFDNDMTLMNFENDKNIAFKQTFLAMNFKEEYSEKLLKSYSLCNQKWWDKLEKNECTREELFIGRFNDFFKENNLTCDAEKINKIYRQNLGKNNSLLDGAEKLIEDLSKNYKIFIITNGNTIEQKSRLKNSPIYKFIEKIFISEEIGFAKPDKKFFEYIFQNSEIENKSDCIVIGDSLSSDIKGANNSELDCIWFNPKGTSQSDLKINYTAKNYAEIREILK
ncbi:MAG: YjjG family noncanonical pyrimidine nucleotidase [Clostridia bacterium]